MSSIIKLAFIDTETTGLDPALNDPFQIAIIYRDLWFSYDLGKFRFEFVNDQKEAVFYLQPTNFNTISPEALAVNGVSIDTLKSYRPAGEVFLEIISFLDTMVDRFDKFDKLVPVGYNVKFDMDFIFKLAEKLSFKFMGSYFNRKVFDVLDHFRNLSLIFPGVFAGNVKLKTVCDVAGLYLDNAHDAMSDIKATKRLFEEIVLPQLLTVQSSASRILGGLCF